MRFDVHCADAVTGREYEWTIECSSRVEAERRMQAAGMLVSSVSVASAGGALSRGSIYGIAAIAMGGVAFLLCWIPIVSIITIPVSFVGLILAWKGLRADRRCYSANRAFPIGGVTISSVALATALITGASLVWQFLLPTENLLQRYITQDDAGAMLDFWALPHEEQQRQSNEFVKRQIAAMQAQAAREGRSISSIEAANEYMLREVEEMQSDD